MFYYKMINENGEIIGLHADGNELSGDELYDELTHVTLVQITYEEYVELCEKFGIDP